MDETRRSLLHLEVPLGVLGASLVVLAFVFAAVGIPGWIPPALLVRFGIASPLTGMTRSFVAMAHGDIGRAFVLHPLGPLCFGASVLAAGYAVGAMWRGRRTRWVSRVVGTRWFGVMVGVAFALAWIRQIKEAGV